MTSMQQLLNYLKKERSVLPLPIEWDKCYQGIEMMIENTYIPLEKEQIEYAWNSAGGGDAYHSGKEYYQETFISNGSDFKQFSLYEHKDTITSADTPISKTFLERVPKQETLCKHCGQEKILHNHNVQVPHYKERILNQVSDEEIEVAKENAWSDYEYQEGNLYSTTFSDGWKMAIEWYKEQLIKKN
jgi:hypothetical protein